MKFKDNEINFSILDERVHTKGDEPFKGDESFIALSKNTYDDIIKHSNGYAYDSLVFRYQKARYANLEQEIKDLDYQMGVGYAEAKCRVLAQCRRDVIKFCQILDDVIGEHD